MYNSQFSQHNWAVSTSLLFPFRRVHQRVVGRLAMGLGLTEHTSPYTTIHRSLNLAHVAASQARNEL